MVIVDDHVLFADAVEASLTRAGFDVVAVASNGDRARAAVNVHQPDLVVLDLHLPGSDGVDLGADLLSRHPEVKLILITGFPDAESMKRALSVGFHGFLSKDASMSEFITALRAVMEGNVVLPARFAPRMAGARSDEEQSAAMLARQLTEREWEILEFLVAGLSSGQIAQSMAISVNTVRTHVQNVLASSRFARDSRRWPSPRVTICWTWRTRHSPRAKRSSSLGRFGPCGR